MAFLKNLSLFLLGLACQVLASIFPKLQGALIGPGSLLLSLADLKLVTNGSFVKHMTLFVLGIACNVIAALLSARFGSASTALLLAGTTLMSNSDLRRILKGPEVPAAPMVTPDVEAKAK
jgi:hypothetical protein